MQDPSESGEGALLQAAYRTFCKNQDIPICIGCHLRSALNPVTPNEV